MHNGLIYMLTHLLRFDHAHSSLRCTIERTFGVWKNRWKILHHMPRFPFTKQVKIVIASMVLHNFIRVNADIDQEFKPYDDNDDKLPSDDEEENATQDVYEKRRPNHEMDKERDSIATLLMLR
ncbi:hypothetical protein EZV62_027062 [Acer yangbiense]|uniref:DDE Tnp4 domain-containing protein n=1 Tax=Acer yangbiense TaxID=1000413 RepID=A0A5C7GSR9_9ROSI|nr:hypothetical protein EZV62_027062 [Acer yangbiense]